MEHMTNEEMRALLTCLGAVLRRDLPTAIEERARFKRAKAKRERRTITVHGEAVV